MKSLILYYSFEGNTEYVAKSLGQYLSATIEKITPVKELKSKGFSKFIWGGSQVVMGKKPEIDEIVNCIDDYEMILIGSPIWAGTYAPPIKTLVEGDYIKNKKVAYFYTHEGGHSKATERAKEAIQLHNTFVDSIDFLNPMKNETATEKRINTWANQLLER